MIVNEYITNLSLDVIMLYYIEVEWLFFLVIHTHKNTTKNEHCDEPKGFLLLLFLGLQ